MDQILQISWPSYITRDKAIAFVQSLIRKRHMENTDPMEYTDMAAVYFREKISTDYRKIIKPLLDLNILQSTKYYRPGYYNEEAEFVKGQCLSYRINPELLDDEVIKVIYKGEKKRQQCRDEVTMRSKQIMRQIRIPDMNSRELISFVKKSLTDERIRRMLKVNEQINDKVIMLKCSESDICNAKGGTSNMEGTPPPPTAPCHDRQAPPKGDKVHIRHVERDKIQLRTKDLIKDGKYCHIEHLDSYIKRKRRHLTQAYCDQLLRIKHRNVYADRNETNLRLDSNLTNLKSDFMSLLQLDGHRLSQIDLKNSQFRFFVMLLEQCERQTLFCVNGDRNIYSENLLSQTAKSENKVRLKKGKEIRGKPVTLLLLSFVENCLKKEGLTHSLTADYKLFRKLGKTGELYEYIQKIYWAETGVKISRDEAKKLMFTVSFASHRYWPEGKRVLQKHFPSIIAVIDGYKKAMIEAYANEQGETSGNVSAEAREKGNASFAILLQQVESLVFVDKILAECHKRGLKVLSKHDSIICRQCDKRFVTGLICRMMNEIFGKYTYSLDIDGEVFQLRAKRKSRMHRVATEFVMTLFGMENRRANAPPRSPEAIMSNEKWRINNEIMSNELSGSQARHAATHPCPLVQREGVERSALLADGKIRNPRIAAMKLKIMGK